MTTVTNGPLTDEEEAPGSAAARGMSGPPVLVTGIRPTGRLHVGNLVGAMRALTSALTTPDESDEPLSPRTRHVVRTYLAAGLDTDRTVLYRQSGIAQQVCELFTYLAMVAPLGEVLRCPTFKEKVARAVSDPQRIYRHQPGHPTADGCNVFHLHTFFTPQAERDAIAHDCRVAAIGCVDCKQRLAASIEAFVAPLRQASRRLSHDEVMAVLRAGEARVRQQAQQTLIAVREAMGLRYL